MLVEKIVLSGRDGVVVRRGYAVVLARVAVQIGTGTAVHGKRYTSTSVLMVHSASLRKVDNRGFYPTFCMNAILKLNTIYRFKCHSNCVSSFCVIGEGRDAFRFSSGIIQLDIWAFCINCINPIYSSIIHVQLSIL